MVQSSEELKEFKKKVIAENMPKKHWARRCAKKSPRRHLRRLEMEQDLKPLRSLSLEGNISEKLKKN